MNILIAWTIFSDTEEIEEIEIDVKGVIPVSEKKYISRALEIAGTDVRFIGRGRLRDFHKAIVMPYKNRGRNRNVPEVPDCYVDLGEFNDEYYYLIFAAGSLTGAREKLILRGNVYIVVNCGERFMHNDILYEWCIIQRLTEPDKGYYDKLDNNSPCRAAGELVDGLPT